MLEGRGNLFLSLFKFGEREGEKEREREKGWEEGGNKKGMEAELVPSEKTSHWL